MTDLFIGVDAGSSVCKAAAFDVRGNLISLAAERTPLIRGVTSRVESNPEAAWQAFCRVLRRVASETGGIGTLQGIAVSGAMVGAWVLDEDGNTLRTGINWEDSRAQPIIDSMLANRPSLMSDIFSVSGSVMQQGCTLPLLAALVKEEPEALSRATAVVGYKDWLRARLTGQIATDVSEASVAPGDARKQGRSVELISLFGLDAHAKLLPDALPSEALAGEVTASAAAQTGLPRGLPVAVGSGDVIANVIGSGGLSEGVLTGLLGTTCILGLCRSEPVFEPQDLGLLFSMPEQFWFRAMVNVAGTLNLDWITSVLFPEHNKAEDRFARMEAIAETVEIGAGGVSYLPYLSESGVIAPVADAAARAGFSGLAPRHGREVLLRAVYEGVAYSIADLCDLLAPPSDAPIILTGGGGRSALWRTAIAEVTGRTVIVPSGSELGALGAALLASTATGAYPSVEVASAAVAGREAARVLPTGQDSAAWAISRARYAEARDRALGRH